VSSFAFHDAMTPIMFGITALHDHILFFLAVILSVVVIGFILTLIEFVYETESIPEFKKARTGNLFYYYDTP
jgi:hypothetical protein